MKRKKTFMYILTKENPSEVLPKMIAKKYEGLTHPMIEIITNKPHKMKTYTIFTTAGIAFAVEADNHVQALDTVIDQHATTVVFWVIGDERSGWQFDRLLGLWNKKPEFDVTDLILTQTDSGCFISRLTHHDSGDTSSELVDPEKLTKKQLIELLNKPRKK